MTHTDHTALQTIWEVTGDSVTLMERLHLDHTEQNPRLDIHAGQGTLWEAQQAGSDLQLIRAPRQVPDPLIAFAAADVFTQTDVFDSDAPCLIVGPAFIAEFGHELTASCHEVRVKIVMYGTSDLMDLGRPELLRRARPDVTLYAAVPLITIKARRPIRQERRLYVPAEEELPPFFRVPWRKGSVFVRDDIRHRIETKLRGAEFNATALMP